MEQRDRRPPEEEEEQEGAEENSSLFPGTPFMWVMMIMLAFGGYILFKSVTAATPRAVDFNFYLTQLEENNVQKLEQVNPYLYKGQFRKQPDAPVVYDEKGHPDQKVDKNDDPVKLDKDFSVAYSPTMSEDLRKKIDELIVKNNVSFKVNEIADNSSLYMILMGVILPLAMFAFLWMMFKRTRDQLMGGGFLSGFTRSPAKRYEGSQQVITFNEVAGLEGVKADLQEIVDFLKSPDKFKKLGGQVPKGVLLNGPPGTGKTLLARAVAGEAGVPFYSVNGSEFIQMFVGVGASRVRDLFAEAKENAPAIIFIDEVDAVGRQRGAGLGGGHDEREQTLNQILSEMDGFEPNQSVIIIAATNRPDVLDPALLRPGRFDRHVTVDRPTMKGREEIFKVHVREVPLSSDVDLKRLAAGTIGLTGADIRNIVNEAALWAARQDHTEVHMRDFEYARDKVLMGPKREEILRPEEKQKTAYHEAGHTLVAWSLPDANKVHKVTVIPRGRALGVTQILPSEDRLSMSEQELYDHLAVMLAGRAAEKLIYNQHSIGAQNDLERATSVARRMVTQWGMSDKLGPVNYKLSEEDPFLGRELHHGRAFSESTLQAIDEEVSRILHEAAERSYNLLSDKRDQLENLATQLALKEELDEHEIAAIVGPSAQQQKSDSGRTPGTVMAPTPTQIASSST